MTQADNVLTIRDLHSDNSVPALVNATRMGLVTLVGAQLEHGASDRAAIENAGALYLRDAASSGYREVLRGGASSKLAAYTSSDPLTLDGTSASSLPDPLPIAETPQGYREPIEQWADPGLTNGTDDTEAVRAAMGSGKHTIYFRSPSYRVADTIAVPDSIWRIVGMNTRIFPVGKNFADASATRPVFRFVGAQHDVVVERLSLGAWDYSAPGAICIADASPKALALVDCTGEGAMHHFYENVAGVAGPLFIEDIYLPGSSAKAATTWQFDHQRVWARQFDDETDIQRMLNNGGELWILGLKTERVGTVIETKAAGRTEVLGGLLYPLRPSPVAAFVCRDSTQSLSYATTAYGSVDNDYATQVEQISPAGRRTLSHADLAAKGLGRGYGSLVPLVVNVPDSSKPGTR